MIETGFISAGGQDSAVAAMSLDDTVVKAENNLKSLALHGALRRGDQVESRSRLERGVVLVHSRMCEPDHRCLLTPVT